MKCPGTLSVLGEQNDDKDRMYRGAIPYYPPRRINWNTKRLVKMLTNDSTIPSHKLP